MATLSTPVGAPSLGNYIFGGLQTRNTAGDPDGLRRRRRPRPRPRRPRPRRRPRPLGAVAAGARRGRPRPAGPRRLGLDAGRPDGGRLARPRRSSSAPRPSPSSTCSPRSSPAPSGRAPGAAHADARVARLDGGLRRPAPRRDRPLRRLHRDALGDRHGPQGTGRRRAREVVEEVRRWLRERGRRHPRRVARLRERLLLRRPPRRRPTASACGRSATSPATPGASRSRATTSSSRGRSGGPSQAAYGLAFRERRTMDPSLLYAGDRGRAGRRDHGLLVGRAHRRPRASSCSRTSATPSRRTTRSSSPRPASPARPRTSLAGAAEPRGRDRRRHDARAQPHGGRAGPEPRRGGPLLHGTRSSPVGPDATRCPAGATPISPVVFAQSVGFPKK